MKFNLLLLLLTALTAVALSHQTKIKLSHFTGLDLYWAVDGTRVVLNSQGANWTINPSDKNNYTISLNDKYVQYNGPGKQLTIARHDGSPAQLWKFRIAPGFYELICSSDDTNMRATAAEENGGWVVKASSKETSYLQWWSLSHE